MLYQQVDELCGVLHEVHVLVHGAVHDQQPPLLVRQLAHEVEDGAELVAVGLGAGPVEVALGVARVVQLPGGDRGARHRHLHTAVTSASKSSILKFVITEKAPTRAFSWLKAATTAFTFETLLRH